MDDAPALSELDRVRRVYSALGKPDSMAQSLAKEDLAMFAALCNGDGSLVDNFRAEHQKVYLKFLESRRASESDSQLGKNQNEMEE
tara:strand:- start:138 stop:395 length:258 start_codon:yes stop_codon:yes gene_type:complete